MFINILQLLIINLLLYNGNKIPHFPLKIVSSSILNFIPALKFHHIVLLSSNKKKYFNDIYTVDFSPINQSSIQTLLKLMFAMNVPAEIRLRQLKNVDTKEETQIITEWDRLNQINYVESQKLSNLIFDNINDTELKKFITKVRTWNSTMNLYTYNCQHFSNFVDKMNYES